MSTRHVSGQNGQRIVTEVTKQLAALSKMTAGQLADRYRELFAEPTRSHNKAYLRKKIAWRIQELAEGGLSPRARARIEELADIAPTRWHPDRPQSAAGRTVPDRDPRLPAPGTVITRIYQCEEHRVTVLQDSFEHNGSQYSSLSKIAREITGTNWNGFLFFGLQRRARKHTVRSVA